MKWLILLGTSKVRREEPCNRGALRNTCSRCYEFLEEVTCTAEAQKLSKTEVYQLMAEEILSSAEPRQVDETCTVYVSWHANGTRKLGGVTQYCPLSSPFRMVDLFATLGNSEIQRSPRPRSSVGHIQWYGFCCYVVSLQNFRERQKGAVASGSRSWSGIQCGSQLPPNWMDLVEEYG